ncbi:hypothetical protein BW730_03415 [Tessaracoccus aquimaris]|uniref:Uncharacterized protein n=1 Tax=Tessaracoccus aquimaris TaxID=1332264 RepID=A0A1Q2CKT2_9ACTN|nr:hypothetical protein BW730_03415 [Tessaracoccus aquimaris]
MIPTPGPCFGITLVCAVVRLVAADDERVVGRGAGFLLGERAAPDVLFERVEVLVFRAEEEVPRDAMGLTLTHAAPVARFPTPPRGRFDAWACREGQQVNSW